MRKYLVLLCIIYMTTVRVNCQQIDCPAGWMTSRTDPRWPCFLITNKIQRTWTDAQTFCEQMGGGLWKIGSLQEKNWIYNLLNVYHGYYPTHVDWWIGLHDNPAQTGLIWLDRSVPDMQLLQPWVPGEPTQYDRSKACVQYYNGSLRHENCQQTKYFVCKRSRSSVVFCDARNRWESINQNCYKVVTKLRTWNDARAECKKENADLMIVNDQSTEVVVHNFIESRKADMWFGLRAFQSSGTYSYKWQSATGQNLSSVNSFWSSQYQLTSTALQTVTSTNGSSACVIANHTLPNPNFWEPADCGIRAFSLCQKPQGRCASGWLSHGYYCYQIVTWYNPSWQGANSFCKTQGANLIRIRYNSTQQFVNGMLTNLKSRGVNGIWIGLSDNNQAGNTWYWSSGSRLYSNNFKNFNGQTPVNRPGVQDCFNIFTDDKNGTWQIASDCANNNSFICEISRGTPPKLPPTLAPTRTTGSVQGPTTTATPVTWSTDCGPFWVKDSKTAYCYKFSDETLNWFQAQSACQSEGGQLTSINNYEEERFIADRLFGFSSPALWIGMNDLNSHVGYHWVDGTGFGYFNWAPGEPNNVGEYEHCGEVIVGGRNRAKWNDARCDARKGYICKRMSSVFHTAPPPRTPSVPAGMQYGCPSNIWTPYKNSCYMFMKTATNWMNARKFCQSHNSTLASILNENEQNFVFSQLPAMTGKIDQLFIGLNDIDIQRKFQWTDGMAVTYTNWAVNEPNNWQNTAEDCVTIYKKDGTWNDQICEDPREGFICKTHKAILPRSTSQHNMAAGCPAGAIGYGYNCYQLMSSMATWQVARSNCRARAGDLVVIKDSYQQAFLASQIAGRSGFYWTGLSHSGPSGSFQWVSGDNLAYTSWSSNHTGNDNSSCIAMRTNGPGVGLWLDMPCTAKFKYICESSRSGFSTPLIPTTTTITVPVCPQNWNEFNGYCTKVYNSNEDKKSYFDARSACRAMGADLVSLHSYAEQSAVFSYRTIGYTSKTYWIGLNDFDIEKGYKWSDGTAVNYTHWGVGEPNDADGTDDCVEYNSRSRRWNDASCYIAKNFACKIKKGVKLQMTKATPPPTYAPECGSTPDWKLYNGSCYYVNTPKDGPTSRKTWFEASDYCKQHGGDLASIHSLKENGFIATLITRAVSSDCWIGLSDYGVNQFGWNDGSPFDFVHWSGGEPNDAFGSEKCGQIKSSNAYWNDNDCNEKYHFVCKRPQGNIAPTTSLPTTLISGGCPSGFTSVSNDNKCYKLYGARNTAQRMNYTSARDTCRKSGTGYDIASVTNHEEQASLVIMVNGMIIDRVGVWIGINDLNNNQRFTWQDSSRLQYTNWDKNEPQIHGHCVEMYTDIRHAGKWHNIKCGDNRPFVCEATKDHTLPTVPPVACSTISVPGYVDNSMDCYKLDPTPRSWQDAMTSCTKDGTQLTSVITVFEQAFIDTLSAHLNSPVWIGLADTQGTGTYTWKDGNAVVYTSWDKNEPTYGAGRCVVSKNGLWDDKMCTEVYPSICKKPLFNPVSPLTPSPGGYCADITWKQYNNFCYFLNLNPTFSYSAAENDCTSRGMQLASVASKLEENFILQTLDYDQAASVNIWIGFRKKGGFFSWSDGAPVRYVNWNTGPTGKDCVMMRHIDGKWQDSVCSSLKGYICKTTKLPATTAPSTTTTISTPTTSTLSSSSSSSSSPSTTTTVSSTTTPTSTSSSKQTSSISSSNTAVQRNSPSQGGASNHPVSPKYSGSTVYIPSWADKQKQNQNQSNGDLSAGQVVGIVVGTLLILAIACVALLIVKRRSDGNMFSFHRLIGRGGVGGFDNAAYDKGMDSVNITKNGKNGHVTNGNSVVFADFSGEDGS
ncbi:macrophage mannose receptor 1-like isoform X2 [Mercenaria mercenaria]|uniref:macrophage mannose receptor 1-like isoform X2 n=1 Tax=Mercenaria mercenaria TaxID=6596 RepID=UPI00234FB28B|nr:macrophage mannose receptor 1-like isoform X2 [Mercenaria mercenaria]